jgi:adenylate cyclase
MATEIERKFLVTGDSWRQPDPTPMSQGYLSLAKERTVRVRIAGDRAYLTIKGATVGVSRPEFEYEIPVADAEAMLAMCDGPIVRKARHLVTYRGSQWEVDEFSDDNAGLVVAEIELESEDQPFERPDWLGQEVSDDPRYLNSNLAVTPYSDWAEK